mmetsp:Transcript_29048/g.78613  ORF Transcript_29048/g.78613 Transcript_29048/m.78613 type:complete len:395 (+) Transcript_29048:195-1379(+)|eukprot:CAMPEP_0172374810 /NCGR_PEP_ID=MMETSP1060-20121228/57765_1 /TAXON_ID=37318 /ORGANISM="Pseudo-nitzschia pungens, Strain cf. cingulata" /LENGTH=394 /DNA_ID=CAMNT_0013101643 /DNA_START=107 /DNA_END=1291 /DNA_ORIENTATION=-
MRVGIIGNGIVGTAIAATLAKHRPSVEVILIDDGRPHKTSEAGQGYLFSIHRFDDPVGLETSVMARRAWRDLLMCEEEEEEDNDDNHEPLLQNTGSLLIAPHRDTELLRDYYQRARDSPHLPGLEYLPDAVERNELLKPGTFRGLFFPGDCTCNPPRLIDRLQTRFGLATDHRTVTDLRAELRSVAAADSSVEGEEEEEEKDDDDDDNYYSNARLFDCVICCAGPWINELEDVGVEPVRGLLLEAAVGDDCCCDNSSSKGSEPVPVMEYGYGTEGIHFTLSSRGGALLVGASREGVGFSTGDLEDLEEAILKHANRFVVEGAIGPVARRRLGFRPACNTDDNGAALRSTERKRNYRIQTSAIDERIILVYGFEGQGVLYAPLAAMDVVNDYFST